jgi:crotonobetainyl-CoA:carnitine CoA-transferase CaiB-like acyl-CoA transferase
MLPDAAYWSRLCKAIGLEDLIEDERFVDSKARYKNMAELIDIFDNTLAAKSRDEWGKIFDDANLIWGPVMGLHEVPQDPHAQELGMFPTIEHPELGSYNTVNIPMRFATADVKPRGPAPLLGDNSEQVLRDFGMDNEAIAVLKAAGTIAQREQD